MSYVADHGFIKRGPKLHSCECCGFLSTLGSEFTWLEGLRVDKDCAERYRLGLDPHVRWIKQKLEANARARIQEGLDGDNAY